MVSDRWRTARMELSPVAAASWRDSGERIPDHRQDTGVSLQLFGRPGTRFPNNPQMPANRVQAHLHDLESPIFAFRSSIASQGQVGCLRRKFEESRSILESDAFRPLNLGNSDVGKDRIPRAALESGNSADSSGPS